MINNQKRMLLSSFNQLIQSISKPRWRLNQLENVAKPPQHKLRAVFNLGLLSLQFFNIWVIRFFFHLFGLYWFFVLGLESLD